MTLTKPPLAPVSAGNPITAQAWNEILSALGALFDRHHDAVYRLISRLLSTEPSAIDDLVQTTSADMTGGGYAGMTATKGDKTLVVAIARDPSAEEKVTLTMTLTTDR